MTDKATHIKNPLTVIAIFAGIAEVGGTAVLPLLAPETQATYVWFLMFFPVGLVSMFFATLWWRHTTLYAPSDFSDENNWVTASDRARRAKEVDELRVERLPPADPMVLTGPLATSGATNDCDSQIALPVTQEPDQTSDVNVRDATARVEDHLVSGATRPHGRGTRESRRMMAEEFILTQIRRTTVGNFRRDVSPAGLPKIVFDAVISDRDSITVIEVRHIVNAVAAANVVSRLLETVGKYYEMLSTDAKANFLLKGYIVVDGPAEHQAIEIESMIKRYEASTKFASELTCVPMSEIEFMF